MQQYKGDRRPLRAAKAWIESARWDGAAECPCCTLENQVYARRLNRGLVWALLIFARRHSETKKQWVYTQEIRDHRFHNNGGERAKLRYWGFIERKPPEDDGSHPRGWWRVTKKGYMFLRGEISVHQLAVEFDNELLSLEGTKIFVSDAWNEPFDLSLMLSYKTLQYPGKA